ncbi:MAG: hypothetical protein JWM37_838 [Candidatus Saccharibacteria bacterium]|nr:hypothetical protein [Candidatus Saccharibacteria bacterium]
MTTTERTNDQMPEINPADVHHLADVALEWLPDRGIKNTLGDLPTALDADGIRAVADIARLHNQATTRFAERQTIATLGRLSSHEKRADFVTAKNAAEYLRHDIGGVVARFQAWRIDATVRRNQSVA